MRAAGAWISGVAFFALSAALVAVGLVSWRRTRGTRRDGDTSRAPPDSPTTRTSRLTWLAAGAGVAATAWGAAIVVTSAVPGLGLLAGGAFVTLTGLQTRVTHIHADAMGMTIRYARSEPFHLAWRDFVSLRPPRTPFGGWRFEGRTRTRTLMPSDLWGKEGLLPLAVHTGGLRLDGRRWSAEPTRR
jgi:hypothetical protein